MKLRAAHLALLLVLASAATAFARPDAYEKLPLDKTRPDFDFFKPALLAEEWYSQSWSYVGAANDGTFVQVQFLISNIGPGDNKGSYRIVIAPPGQPETLRKEEFDTGKWHYEATANRLTVGPHSQTRSDGTYAIHIDGDPGCDLTYTPLLPAFRPGGGRVTWDDAKHDFYDITLLFPRARMSGTIRLDGKTFDVDGFATANTSYASFAPHKQGKLWYRFMGISQDYTLLATVFNDAENEKTQVGWLYVGEGASPTAYSVDTRMQFADRQIDEQARFKYAIPQKVKLSADDIGVEAVIKINSLVFRQDVLGDLSWLARQAVQLVSKPIANTYTNTARVRVTQGGATTEHEIRGLSEISFVNP